MSETVTKVCFSMDGGWFADFARTRLAEGAWDRALQLLIDTMGGMTHDQAIAILKGEATLIGDTRDEAGIRFKKLPKDGKLAKCMQGVLDHMYKGLFRIGDEIWKPYAVVSGWCREDWHFATTFTAPHHLLGVVQDRTFKSDDRARIGAFRSLFYANDPHRDLLVRIPEVMTESGDVVADVLCERFTGSVPFWYKLPHPHDPITYCHDMALKLEMRGATNGLDETPAERDAVEQEPGVPLEDQIETFPPASEEAPIDKVTKRQTALELIDATLEYLKVEHTPEDLDEIKKMSRIFERGIDVLHKEIKGDEWDVVDDIRKRYSALIESTMQTLVIRQAEKMGGFFDLPLRMWDKENGKHVPYPKRSFLKVPLHPFILWAVRYFNFEQHGKVRPEWTPVAGSGWKMVGDDPYHTDWMLGAGVPLDETYDHEDTAFGQVVRSSAYDYANKIVEEQTGHKFMTLARTERSYFFGDITRPGPNERCKPGSIAIVPNAGPDYQNAMETACGVGEYGPGLIICETGGKLAHLAVVGREFKCTVLMMPNVMSLYREGESVSINVDEGTIHSRRL